MRLLRSFGLGAAGPAAAGQAKDRNWILV